MTFDFNYVKIRVVLGIQPERNLPKKTQSNPLRCDEILFIVTSTHSVNVSMEMTYGRV